MLLPTPPSEREPRTPAGDAARSAGPQLTDERKAAGREGDIYLGVLLKQKMLTSPQSFINCSFQVCQRGKGGLGRLRRAEKREKRRQAVEWQGPPQLHTTRRALYHTSVAGPTEGRHQSQGCMAGSPQTRYVEDLPSESEARTQTLGKVPRA